MLTWFQPPEVWSYDHSNDSQKVKVERVLTLQPKQDSFIGDVPVSWDDAYLVGPEFDTVVGAANSTCCAFRVVGIVNNSIRQGFLMGYKERRP